MARRAPPEPTTSNLCLINLHPDTDDWEAGPLSDDPRDVARPPLRASEGFPFSFLKLSRALSAANSTLELLAHLTDFFETQIQTRGVLLVPTPASTQLPFEQARIATLASEYLANVASVLFDAGDERWVAASLDYRGTHQGILAVSLDADHDVDDEALDLIELVAFTCAGELTRLLDVRNAEEHLGDLNFIRTLEQEISHARDLPAMASIVRNQLGDAVDCTLCALLIADSEGTHLEVVAYRNDTLPEKLGFKVPVVDSKVGSVFLSGIPVVIGNVLEDDYAYSRESANWRSLMIAPLTGGDQVFGTLMIGHTRPDFYDERDLRIVQLVASQVANAIYRFLEEEREQTQHLAAIEALSGAVDARDPFTHTHSRRVADLAYRVAREMGLSERDARQIELAGLLHDIGKIGVPDRILTKPGRLDAEERLIMMNHAVLGARIIERSSALAGLVPIVRHHHEWFDGRGYPDGLSGDEIPLSAAIIGVVDALETMTSNRVYRRAIPLAEARSEIERGRGGQFHPEVVDVVLSLIDTDPAVFELLQQIPVVRHPTGALAPIRSSDVAGLRVLSRIAAEIGELTELKTFLQHVHTIVCEELEIEDVLIWLHDAPSGELLLAAGTSELSPPSA